MLQVRNRVLALGVVYVSFSGVSVAQGAPRALWVDDNCSPPTTGSCDDPYCTINEAITASSQTEVDTIWVRPGTYTPLSGGTIDVFRKLKLRSTDGPVVTTIRARVLFNTTGQGPETLLEGFTVTNPNGTGIQCIAVNPTIRGNVVTGCTNGGIILNDSQALVIDNVISNNQAQSGAGILIINLDDGEKAKIVDCQLFGNTAQSGSGGGILADSKGEVWLVNTVIRGNTAATSGGGGYFLGAPSSGSAGLTDPCSTVQLTVHLQNCLFTCNKAFGSAPSRGGGGVNFSSFSKGELSNCTFAQNEATGWGGALFAGASCVNAYNSIFWDDTASAGAEMANELGNLTIAYNVLEGGCAGVHLNFPYAFSCTNVIPNSPQFLDPNGADNILCNADDDYRLDRGAPGGSPAVDSGNNTKVTLDFVDVDRNGIIEPRTPRDLPDQAHLASHAGRDRFVDDTMTNNTGVPDPGPPAYPDIVDMGAYETAKCTTDANCEDPASCFGNASCVSTWCDISRMADCNSNLKEDFCDMVENNCNNNALPDDCEVCGGPFPAKLIDDDAEYPCDGSLPRIRRQVLRAHVRLRHRRPEFRAGSGSSNPRRAGKLWCRLDVKLYLHGRDRQGVKDRGD